MKDKKNIKTTNMTKKRKRSETESTADDSVVVPPSRFSDEPVEKKVCFQTLVINFVDKF